MPAINQIELHPHMQQAGLRSYHERHGIRTEAWSPIGQGKGLLDAPEFADIAQAHGKSPRRWCSAGTSSSATSSSRSR